MRNQTQLYNFNYTEQPIDVIIFSPYNYNIVEKNKLEEYTGQLSVEFNNLCFNMSSSDQAEVFRLNSPPRLQYLWRQQEAEAETCGLPAQG